MKRSFVIIFIAASLAACANTNPASRPADETPAKPADPIWTKADAANGNIFAHDQETCATGKMVTRNPGLGRETAEWRAQERLRQTGKRLTTYHTVRWRIGSDGKTNEAVVCASTS